MDIALNQNKADIKILSALNNVKLSNIEKILTNMFENMQENKNFNYIGELNKTDALY